MKRISMISSAMMIMLVVSVCFLIFCSIPGNGITYILMDVHGAGAQRSDPKTGDPSDYPYGHGPQGDVIRIYNFVRCVRGTSQVSSDYTIVDTNQTLYFNNTIIISPPNPGDDFYGQDANYTGVQSSYNDNGDGTITDNRTGLMWQKDTEDKMTHAEAVTGVSIFNLAGYSDWRLPTIKELYSLMDFSGQDPSGYQGTDTSGLVPFIDTNYFVFEYGDTSIGERTIDAQYATSTLYVSTTMNGAATMFGVNFADGRIKGYPYQATDGEPAKEFFVMYVRGNTNYGKNNFVDNGDNTITDTGTDLMWMKDDSGILNAGDNSDGKLTWEQALEWAENLDYGGYTDWRLPDIKELQSIVDYTRSPDTTNSAAIDPVFNTSSIIDEGGNTNYPFYWSGTTHQSTVDGQAAAYIAFGEALGYMTDMAP